MLPAMLPSCQSNNQISSSSTIKEDQKDEPFVINIRFLCGFTFAFTISENETIYHLTFRIAHAMDRKMRPFRLRQIKIFPFNNPSDIVIKPNIKICDIAKNGDTLGAFISPPSLHVKRMDTDTYPSKYIDRKEYKPFQVTIFPDHIPNYTRNSAHVYGEIFLYNPESQTFMRDIVCDFKCNSSGSLVLKVKHNKFFSEKWEDFFSHVTPQNYRKFVLENFNFNDFHRIMTE
jgi:hypothetical protein